MKTDRISHIVIAQGYDTNSSFVGFNCYQKNNDICPMNYHCHKMNNDICPMNYHHYQMNNDIYPMNYHRYLMTIGKHLILSLNV